MGTYDDATNLLSFTLMFNGLTGTTTAAHFHGPADPGVNAGVRIALAGFPIGITAGTYSNDFVLTPVQEAELICGKWYINIHTSTYPGGEIRSQLKEGMTIGNISSFELALTGLKEVLPNVSPATGTLTGTYDSSTNMLSIDIKFNGLIGLSTAAHLHGPALPNQNAGVQIGFVGFPAGVSSGTYSNTYVLTPLQESQLLSGLWYVNIHSSFLPGGEIRAQLTEGTLKGDCTVAVLPVSNWALILGGLLMAVFTVFMLKRRS
jgi:hypothetical protein